MCMTAAGTGFAACIIGQGSYSLLFCEESAWPYWPFQLPGWERTAQICYTPQVPEGSKDLLKLEGK